MKAGWPIIRSVEQLGEVGDDDAGAVFAQRVGVVDAVDADDEAEVAGAARFDPGERVLEDGRRGRLDAERLRRRPGRCRAPACPCSFSRVGDHAVDPLLEELLDPGRPQHRLAVGAGRDDGAPQPGVARRFDEADRAR